MCAKQRKPKIPMKDQLRLITECRQSGLTDVDWCRENNVNPSTFYSWIKRCRKAACSSQIPPASYGRVSGPRVRQDVVAIEVVPDSMSEPAGVPAEVHPEPYLDNSHAIEVVWKDFTLRITNQATADLLSQTLHAIREIVC